MFDSYKRLISIRISEEAFNPFGEFEFLDLDHRLFVIDQSCCGDENRIIAIHNFSNEEVVCKLPETVKLPLCDILSSKCMSSDEVNNIHEIKLEPYQIMWLKGKI
jgi:sucrose phosphorylase